MYSWLAPRISNPNEMVKIEMTDLGLQSDGAYSALIKIPGYTLRTKYRPSLDGIWDNQKRLDFDNLILKAFDIDTMEALDK